MEKKNPIIHIEDLHFTYPKRKAEALKGIDLDIDKGEFVAVIGPSLAGKSTLCMSLNGLVPHDTKGKKSGSVVVNGLDTADNRPYQLCNTVSMVFQDFEAQLFCTNAALDVAFGPENLGLPSEEIRRRVDDCMEMVGLSGFQMREPSSLSGGEKQRLAIASALAFHSDILVLDEPTTDLDPVGKQMVIDVADQLRREGDLTIICVEHEVEELIKANRIVLVVDGKIELDGTPQEILTKASLIKEKGVMPLGACELQAALGLAPTALRVDDCVERLLAEGYRVNAAKYAALTAAEKGRESRYGDEVIVAEDVCFRYPDTTRNAVDHVSFSVREGEFIAIMGQNGSGKTTLAKQLNGLLKKTSGRITVYGQEVETGIFNLSRYIGYVFQNPDHQIFAETIWDEVSFGPRNYKMPEDELKASVEEALRAVDLEGREKEDPFSLTKGERQRVAIASVLAMKPKILILDEPTTGLDYKEQCGVMELLKTLNESGRTVIIITHTMWVASQYAHRAIIMNDSRMLMDGPVREVFRNEEELTALHLKPPQITQIGNRFGYAFTCVDDALKVLEKG